MLGFELRTQASQDTRQSVSLNAEEIFYKLQQPNSTIKSDMRYRYGYVNTCLPTYYTYTEMRTERRDLLQNLLHAKGCKGMIQNANS